MEFTMQPRRDIRFTHGTSTNAAAFVICPENVFVGGSLWLPFPRPVYANAFERAQRLVAQQAYWRLRAAHLNLN
jgi:hypothetical protein